MQQDVQSAQEDLAFIRAIVDEPDTGYKNFGILYLAAGVLYGLQCVIIGIGLSGWVTIPSGVMLVCSWLPTIFFLLVLFAVTWRERKNPHGTSAAKRAVNAAFSGAGVTNIVLVFVFGFAAFQRQDFTIWMFFPVVVFALQGAMWYVAAVIRKRSWMGFVAAGWLISAGLIGIFIPNPVIYNWICTAALFLFMAVPGFIMLRADADKI